MWASIALDCAYPQGMETGAIKDQQISVSSFKNPLTLGHKGRLNGNGAWSAALNDKNQWLEVWHWHYISQVENKWDK